MAKFMILIGGAQRSRSGSSDYDPVMDQYKVWTQKILAHAEIASAHKLADGQGRRLTLANRQIVDGPHVETKETIGGYYVIEVKDLDAATALARECPTLTMQGGFVEVRPVEF